MFPLEITEKPLPAVRLAARTTVVAAQSEVPGVVGPMFDAVAGVLAATGSGLDLPIALYEMAGDSLRIVVGYACSGPVPGDLEAVDLPAVPAALCGTHEGPMTGIAASWQQLYDELARRGLEVAGPAREVYLHAVSEDQSDWVTELQLPAAGPGAGPGD